MNCKRIYSIPLLPTDKIEIREKIARKELIKGGSLSDGYFVKLVYADQPHIESAVECTKCGQFLHSNTKTRNYLRLVSLLGSILHV